MNELNEQHKENVLMEKVGNIFQVSGWKAGFSHSLWQRGGSPGQLVFCQLLHKKQTSNSHNSHNIVQSEVLILYKGTFVFSFIFHLLDIHISTFFVLCLLDQRCQHLTLQVGLLFYTSYTKKFTHSLILVQAFCISTLCLFTGVHLWTFDSFWLFKKKSFKSSSNTTGGPHTGLQTQIEMILCGQGQLDSALWPCYETKLIANTRSRTDAYFKTNHTEIKPI